MKDFHNAYLMTGNLVASIQRLPAVSVMTDINFPMKGRKGMVDWARNSEDKVVIPKGLFVSQSADMEGSPVFILGTVLYKTLGLMLPSPKNHTVVNSKVIAVTVRPEPKSTESHLEIELAHLANGTMNPYCALWDSTIITSGLLLCNDLCTLGTLGGGRSNSVGDVYSNSKLESEKGLLELMRTQTMH
ncbi:Adhesion G protein-coupled receptor B3 [Liparis tanakae]|uniref:Adhesion G protein-coupled receptor B3 n=1 Tax=Liparis tanakae TaxID=230148 RepID=A0A4Z2HBQ7_9TELE|nr:Adhesion G protein-coupled receptor B3 [Liparis tanakae]